MCLERGFEFDDEAQFDGVDFLVEVDEYGYGGCLEEDLKSGPAHGEAGVEFVGVHHARGREAVFGFAAGLFEGVSQTCVVAAKVESWD